jgi:hypothetical protein
MALINLPTESRSFALRANVDLDINNTFSWTGHGKQGLILADDYGESPGAFVTDASPEPGYNPYFGAPGYYADKVGDLETIWARTGHPSPGSNPWDYVYGGIGADPYRQGTAARYLASQEGADSFI